jgi:hypothetical protein
VLNLFLGFDFIYKRAVATFLKNILSPYLGLRWMYFSIQCSKISERALLLRVPRLRQFILLITLIFRWWWVWSWDENILTVRKKSSHDTKTLFRCHFFYKSFMDWPSIESSSPRWFNISKARVIKQYRLYMYVKINFVPYREHRLYSLERANGDFFIKKQSPFIVKMIWTT